MYPPVAQLIVTFLDTGFQTFPVDEVKESRLVKAICITDERIACTCRDIQQVTVITVVTEGVAIVT